MLAEICKQWQLAVFGYRLVKGYCPTVFIFFTNRMNPPKARLLKVIKGYGISDSFITFYNPFNLEPSRICYLLDKPIQ